MEVLCQKTGGSGKKPLPVSNVPVVKGPDLVVSGANTTKPLKVWVVKN